MVTDIGERREQFHPPPAAMVEPGGGQWWPWPSWINLQAPQSLEEIILLRVMKTKKHSFLQ